MTKLVVVVRIAVTLACVYSVVQFWTLNNRLTAVPERSGFFGSVDALLEGSGVDSPPVRSLLVVSHSLIASQPNRLQVELIVCGKVPSADGVLVFSGDARLSRPVQRGPGGELKAVSLQPVHAVSNAGLPFRTLPPERSLELIRFHLEGVPACVTPEEGQGPVPLGTAVVIGGDARSPVVEKSGVRYWLAPPLVGEIPGVFPTQQQVVKFDRISGNYHRGIDRSYGIRYEMSATFARDFVQPDPVDGAESSGSLEWQETNTATAARALVIDVDAQQATQNALVFWSIAFGIAGSLLATMIWQLVFGNTSNRAVANGHISVDGPSSEVASDKTTLCDALIVAAVLALGLARMLTRRKRKSG